VSGRHRIAPGLVLDEADLEVADIRSSGPGGQNVNKVASAIQLRLDLARLGALDDGLRLRLVRLAGRRLTDEGTIVIRAQEHRSQARNRAAALDRLLALLREAATPPRPRRAGAVPRGQRVLRREAKRRRGALKRLRRAGPEGDS
jgi:ribosome-associated protein